jgi:ABC-type polysaccharide/polyol phosphate export permease
MSDGRDSETSRRPPSWTGRSAVVQLTLVKLREYLREPEALFWVFAFPVLLTLALGVAFRGGGAAPARVGVVQTDNARERRAVVEALSRDPRLAVREIREPDAGPALRDGEVALVVVPTNPPTYRYDPTRPESSAARFLVDEVLQREAGRQDAFDPVDDRVVIPGSRYIDWLVPGLLGMNVMMTSLWGIGFGIGMARSRKLLKRLAATPMHKASYLAAQVLGRLTFLVFEAAILLVFARFAFGMPMLGSWLLVALLTLMGAIAGAALSLLVASRARTVEGVSGLINVAVLPMWLFSGVFFSSANFPDPMQPFIQALPLTALNDALRDVILAGAGPIAIAGEMAILGAWIVIPFLVALRLFRWQ